MWSLTVNFQPQNFSVRYDFVLLAIRVSLVFDFRVSDTYGQMSIYIVFALHLWSQLLVYLHYLYE